MKSKKIFINFQSECANVKLRIRCKKNFILCKIQMKRHELAKKFCSYGQHQDGYFRNALNCQKHQDVAQNESLYQNIINISQSFSHHCDCLNIS